MNRHISYRRSVYRKRRIRTVLIAIGVAIVVLFLLFLIVGNLFSNKMDDPSETEPPTETVETQPPLPADRVRQVQAPALPASGSSNALFQAISSAAGNGSTAVSLSLTDENGMLLYRSPVASRLDFSIQSSRSQGVSDVASVAHSYGLYLCGTFRLAAQNEENALDRSALLSQAASVVAESFSLGMDDITLLAPDFSSEYLSELCRFAEDVKRLAPNAVLGLSLPESVINEADAATVEQLAYAFDYLALDLSNYGNNDPVEFAEARTGSMLYYLLRYKMRVIVPTLSDTDRAEALLAVLSAQSLGNFMMT